MVMLVQPSCLFLSTFSSPIAHFSRESSLPSSSPSLALFVNYPGGAVHRQLDRSNLEITRPILSPKLAALNTRALSHPSYIGTLPPVCVRVLPNASKTPISHLGLT